MACYAMLEIITALITFADLKLSACLVNGVPEIIEPPRNQYILQGEIANFTCKTLGATSTHWSINGSLTYYAAIRSKFEQIGVVFSNSSNDNLTMMVPACQSTKVNNIICIAEDSSRQYHSSDTVNLYVFKSFRPDSPLVSIEVVYHPTLLPQLYLTIRGQPLWPDFEISEFRVTITHATNGSLLQQIITSNDSTNSTIQLQIDLSQFMFTSHQCYSLTISTSAVSPLYDGESEFTQVTKEILRTPGTFADADGVTPIVLFNSNGTLSHAAIHIQLPDLCSDQGIHYSIVVEEYDVNNETVDIIVHGPYDRNGSGVVSQEITGLTDDHRYSVKVKVDSLPGIAQSRKYFFSMLLITAMDNSYTGHYEGYINDSTKKECDCCLRQSCGTVPLTPSDDASLYIIVMGTAFGIALAALSVSSVLVVCFCIHCQTKRQPLQGPAVQQMITNPIYDPGEAYESINPPSETSHSESPPHMSTCRYSDSPTCDNNITTSSLDTAQCTHEIAHTSYPLSAQPSYLGNTYSTLESSVSMGTTRSVSCSLTEQPPLSNIRKKDRNLHLTLPGVPPSFDIYYRSRDRIEPYQLQGVKLAEESPYVHMRQSGTLNLQAIQPVQ